MLVHEEQVFEIKSRETTMSSAPPKSLQEFLKLLFLDKLLPQAQMIFYLEGVQGILNLPADTNLFSDEPEIPFLMHAGLRALAPQ